MPQRLTDQIRSYVVDRYIEPARSAGQSKLTVRVNDIRTEFEKEQPMRGKSVVICQALQGRKWLTDVGLQIEEIDGPPSKKSPTVVMHYRLLASGGQAVRPVQDPGEASDVWAARVVGKMRGLLKDELAEYGGGEAFLRWVRSEE